LPPAGKIFEPPEGERGNGQHGSSLKTGKFLWLYLRDFDTFRYYNVKEP
jgi:hypothetical protein